MFKSHEFNVGQAGQEFSAYAAVPAQPSTVGIVVLQEIFGVNGNIRSIVNGFAEAGYAAIAPDLYWRQAAGIQLDPGSEDGRQQAMALMKSLDREQSVADATVAIAELRELAPAITRTAAVGYCYGGGVAFLLAARGEVDGGVAYYGTGLHDMLGELEGIQSRLLLHIAEADYLCPPAAQEAIARVADRSGGNVEVQIYPGANHAFARRGGVAFDEAAATRANALTSRFLEALED